MNKEQTLEQRLMQLRHKVERLLEHQGKIVEENNELRKRLLDIEEELKQEKSEKEILEEQNKLIKIAKNFELTKRDKYDVKIKINELVREIDRCIDLLEG